MEQTGNQLNTTLKQTRYSPQGI